MAMEFVLLQELLGSVHKSLVATTDRVEEPAGDVAFAVAKCTIALSVALAADWQRVLARFPPAVDGEHVPPEYLSRITLDLRRGLNINQRP